MTNKNKVMMTSSNKPDSQQKVKALTLPVPFALNLIMDMNEYPKLDHHVKSFVLAMKTHLQINEIRNFILSMFGNKPLDEFKVLYEKEYNILTERFGKAIWS